MPLRDRRILLGVTGGIAAYKSADLVRRLKERGAEVRVAMTEGATAFVTPMTFQALSGQPVHTALLDPAAEAAMGHIELAKWAELVLVAPASADFIARCAHGLADDLLSTLCLATDAPLALAPAMNQAMWRHPATQANTALLESRGVRLLGPGAGSQACGDIGPGRMLEPLEIAEAVEGLLSPTTLAGKRVVITAGPTREAIDPVRYISNHSSGKMGFALASAARALGAEVTLIAGPVSLATPTCIERVNVASAQDMYEACMARMGQCDIFIGAAAVADYRPVMVAEHKIKKTGEVMNIALERNPDIITAVAAHPQRPFTVGFAAETQDVLGYAQDKLTRKQLDMIIANDVSNPAIGFNSDENAVTAVWADGSEQISQASKSQVARALLDLIVQRAGYY